MEDEQAERRRIDDLIEHVAYVLMPSHTAMVCEMRLRNGHYVYGRSVVVSTASYHIELAELLAHRKAREEIWQLEEYVRKDRLTDEVKP